MDTRHHKPAPRFATLKRNLSRLPIVRRLHPDSVAWLGVSIVLALGAYNLAGAGIIESSIRDALMGWFAFHATWLLTVALFKPNFGKLTMEAARAKVCPPAYYREIRRMAIRQGVLNGFEAKLADKPAPHHGALVAHAFHMAQVDAINARRAAAKDWQQLSSRRGR